MGTVIRQRRIALGMTQTELGRLTQTDRTRVSKAEAGEFNATIRTLGRFAASLGLNLSQLIRAAEERARP
jgi:transcriptional regulator with XRE-family HTH domain